jgi:hypothetical protein
MHLGKQLILKIPSHLNNPGRLEYGKILCGLASGQRNRSNKLPLFVCTARLVARDALGIQNKHSSFPKGH